ncbi:hypothetical protein OH77DRAFT_1419094 [Trametes cingulata]|nr:hypothetical protein OH77DRAFT_1419094 [Trametes cingulata]
MRFTAKLLFVLPLFAAFVAAHPIGELATPPSAIADYCPTNDAGVVPNPADCL